MPARTYRTLTESPRIKGCADTPSRINFPVIGIKKVTYSKDGKRMRIDYDDDNELLFLVKHYKNSEIVVGDNYMFVKLIT